MKIYIFFYYQVTHTYNLALKLVNPQYSCTIIVIFITAFTPQLPETKIIQKKRELLLQQQKTKERDTEIYTIVKLLIIHF